MQSEKLHRNDVWFGYYHIRFTCVIYNASFDNAIKVESSVRFNLSVRLYRRYFFIFENCHTHDAYCNNSLMIIFFTFYENTNERSRVEGGNLRVLSTWAKLFLYIFTSTWLLCIGLIVCKQIRADSCESPKFEL